MVDDNNKKTYTARGVVQHYAQLRALQPAEATILELLQNQLVSMKMLDIGVGGGRTTKHFSKVVAEYIGIDYSPNMIAACKKRFAGSSPAPVFEVCDARDMSRFSDNSFDFILFSFNGIDYISHSERLKVFQEIHRVGKSGGYFFFSTHNLIGLEREFNWKKQLSFNPLTTYVNLVMLALMHGFNFPINLKHLQASEYAIIKDESHNFRLNTYYVKPREQIKQLESHFSDIKIYSWKNGRELTHESELNSNFDMWLYYLSVIK
jgi:ubiquinone/menaquinone biosynthesis C-methylase UbiE